MTLNKIISLLSVLAMCSASPLAYSKRQASDIFARDRKCRIESTELYKDIFDCEKKSYLRPDGHCGGSMPGVDEDGACTAYCEIRVNYSYGQEVPYGGSECAAKECKIAKGTSSTVTTTWEINANIGIEVSKGALLGAFNLGASYSFSTSASTSLDIERSEELEEGECGYWTWVPILVDTCGSLTTAPTEIPNDGPFGGAARCNADASTWTSIGNWCNRTPVKRDDGSAAGNTFFVYTKCDVAGGIDWNNKKQSDIYRHPGVSTAADAPKYPGLEGVPEVRFDEDIDLNLRKHPAPARA
ncbi:hypothetical protein BKA65DRAFT_473075 [Rhexocercosporidium sp. MPI-PUGE-AT-0058]|nr:hypothetical protein BKA65DRAFT_473075 [Rhexocercosporidium sp. MPI-PUGE-AT-0058]